MVFESLLVNLESEGYEVQPFIIPACAVNAPHRRDRVWILAFKSSSDRWNGGANNFRIGSIQDATIGKIETDEQKRDRGKLWFRKRDCHVADSQSRKAQPSEQERFHAELSGQNSDVTDTGNEGLQGSEWPGPYEQGKTSYGSITKCNSAWDEPWLETAQRFCQLDARISNRLDGCLTLPETHGIMGFILMLRRYHYATSEETRTRKVLPILREAFGEESVQWCFRRLSEIFEAENLWCSLHGKNDGERESGKNDVPQEGKEVHQGQLREVPDGQRLASSSQGREYNEQCTCQFDDIVFELSSEIALGEWKRNSEKAENILFDLWKESGGERFLHEPLPALYEIWRSVTDQEIGTFRRHYLKRNEHKVQKLKALGNAIVPQVVVPIMQAIKDAENNFS